MIHVPILKNGVDAFCPTGICLYLEHDTFVPEPHQKIKLKTAILMEIIQLLTVLAQEIRHKVFKYSTFVSKQITF